MGPNDGPQRRIRILEFLRRQKSENQSWTAQVLLVQVVRTFFPLASESEIREDLELLVELQCAECRDKEEPLTKVKQTWWRIGSRAVRILDGEEPMPVGLRVE